MGLTTRKMADAKLNEWTEEQAVPVVSIATPDTRGRKTTLDLPGRPQLYTQAQIYARVSGYLKKWNVDIGTPVKAGDLLATKSTRPISINRSCRRKPISPTPRPIQSFPTPPCFLRGQQLIPSGAVSKQDR